MRTDASVEREVRGASPIGPRAAMTMPPRVAAALAGGVFLAVATGFWLLYRRFPVLYDADGYYHLAVARAYAGRGLFATLDWARFSVMHDGFGDKELLFHVLLAPFASHGDATAGGFLALALLDGVIAAALAVAGMAALGPWGLLVPLLVFGGSADFTLRMIRLRPELLSLLFLMAAISLASRRRTVLLGVLACVYTLAYTAFEAFLGLCLLFAAYGFWVERRRDWAVVVHPVIGVGLGLLLHPHFPANLRVWALQNVDFFLWTSTPDVGREILPRTTADALLLNFGWAVGLLVLWRSRQETHERTPDTRLRDLTGLAGVAFGLLYVFMARFVTYFVPFATLALVRAMQVRGEQPGAYIRLPWRGRLPSALMLGLGVLLIVHTAWIGARRMEASAGRTFRADMRADWEAFGRAVPDGAKIMAPWAATHEFVFWAPRASYLNVLDPVFMAARDADLHRLALDVFEGREADIPLVARARFDSDFYADDGQYPFAHSRLVQDPRALPLHEGITFLYRFVEGRNADFVLDWKVLPAGTALPPSLDALADVALPDYPRAPGARERALEGYVDGRRMGDVSGCSAFAHVEDVARPMRLFVEFSPYGTGELYLDDGLAAAVPSPRAAVLGRGVVVPLVLAPGRHRVTVRTCPSGAYLGFYVLVRARESMTSGS